MIKKKIGAHLRRKKKICGQLRLYAYAHTHTHTPRLKGRQTCFSSALLMWSPEFVPPQRHWSGCPFPLNYFSSSQFLLFIAPDSQYRLRPHTFFNTTLYKLRLACYQWYCGLIISPELNFSESFTHITHSTVKVYYCVHFLFLSASIMATVHLSAPLSVMSPHYRHELPHHYMNHKGWPGGLTWPLVLRWQYWHKGHLLPPTN